jgi:hypothetical protein
MVELAEVRKQNPGEYYGHLKETFWEGPGQILYENGDVFKGNFKMN